MHQVTHKFKPNKLVKAFGILATSLAATSASASGIFLQEAVTANAGVAGAGDGVYTESAAAMWTNPATMSYMGESLTTINVMGFDLKMKYTDNGDEAMEKHNLIFLPLQFSMPIRSQRICI
ncbi:long-chain fatty acid transport protein [Vibrio ishigakensis]|uniref:Long-chain fatty acid transport protein n=1 Tax=Vibrio ishigakensis TaxID=1481914 RepID=A0A0B8P7C8_9VIBR|nr:long-chain fatty acid transport protein [Vibrio ishigakensis]